jgi:hypothetical protein
MGSVTAVAGLPDELGLERKIGALSAAYRRWVFGGDIALSRTIGGLSWTENDETENYVYAIAL